MDVLHRLKAEVSVPDHESFPQSHQGDVRAANQGPSEYREEVIFETDTLTPMQSNGTHSGKTEKFRRRCSVDTTGDGRKDSVAVEIGGGKQFIFPTAFTKEVLDLDGEEVLTVEGIQLVLKAHCISVSSSTLEDIFADIHEDTNGDGSLDIHEVCCSSCSVSSTDVTVEKFNYYIRKLRPLSPNEVTARVVYQLKGSVGSWLVLCYALAGCSSIYQNTIKPYRTPYLKTQTFLLYFIGSFGFLFMYLQSKIQGILILERGSNRMISCLQKVFETVFDKQKEEKASGGKWGSVKSSLMQESREILDMVNRSLTRKRFAMLLSKLKVDMSERNIQVLFDNIDKNKDGEADLQEVHAYMSQYSPMTRKQVASKALRACMDFAGFCNIFTVIWAFIGFGNAAIWEDIPYDKINNLWIIADCFAIIGLIGFMLMGVQDVRNELDDMGQTREVLKNGLIQKLLSGCSEAELLNVNVYDTVTWMSGLLRGDAPLHKLEKWQKAIGESEWAKNLKFFHGMLMYDLARAEEITGMPMDVLHRLKAEVSVPGAMPWDAGAKMRVSEVEAALNEFDVALPDHAPKLLLEELFKELGSEGHHSHTVSPLEFSRFLLRWKPKSSMNLALESVSIRSKTWSFWMQVVSILGCFFFIGAELPTPLWTTPDLNNSFTIGAWCYWLSSISGFNSLLQGTRHAVGIRHTQKLELQKHMDHISLSVGTSSHSHLHLFTPPPKKDR